MPDTQQIIHNLEPPVPLRKVSGSHVHDGFELALRVVAEEGEDGDDTRGTDMERQFVFED